MLRNTNALLHQKLPSITAIDTVEATASEKREKTQTSRKFPKKAHTRGITRVRYNLHEAKLTIRQNHRADKTKLSKCLSITMKMKTTIVADKMVTRITGTMPTSQTIATPTGLQAILMHPQPETILGTYSGGTESVSYTHLTLPTIYSV